MSNIPLVNKSWGNILQIQQILITKTYTNSGDSGDLRATTSHCSSNGSNVKLVTQLWVGVKFNKLWGKNFDQKIFYTQKVVRSNSISGAVEGAMSIIRYGERQ